MFKCLIIFFALVICALFPPLAVGLLVWGIVVLVQAWRGRHWRRQQRTQAAWASLNWAQQQRRADITKAWRP